MNTFNCLPAALWLLYTNIPQPTKYEVKDPEPNSPRQNTFIVQLNARHSKW